MNRKKNSYIKLIILTLVVSNVFGLYFFNTKSNDSEIIDEVVPKSSLPKLDDYMIEFPNIDNMYISPRTSPDLYDNITLSYLASCDVDYDFDISALPKPMNHPEITYPSILKAGGRLFIFGVKNNRLYGPDNKTIAVSISEDDGITWSEFSDITPIYWNTTLYSPVAAFNGTSIHLVWRLNASKIYYSSSSDMGNNWNTPQVIQDSTIPYKRNAYYGACKLAIAVDPSSKEIHIVTDLWDDYQGDEIYTFNSTDHGQTWSIPSKIHSISSEDYYSPSIGITSGGNYYLMVYDYGDTSMRIFEFSGRFGGTHNTGLTETSYGSDSCGILGVNNNSNTVYYVSRDNFNDEYLLYQVTGVGAETETEVFKYSPNLREYYEAGIYIDEGVVYHVVKEDYTGSTDLHFEKFNCSARVVSQEGMTPKNERAQLSWNGTVGSKFTHYTSFYIELELNDSWQDTYTFYFFIDNTLPTLDEIDYPSIISPGVEDGNKDNFQLSFTPSETIEYGYAVLSNSTHNITETKASATTFNKIKPKIFRDASYNIYVFYKTIIRDIERIDFVKSTDGGKTWEAEKTATTSGFSDAQYFTAFSDRNSIYLVTKDYPDRNQLYLKRSIDEGQSWSQIELDPSFNTYHMAMTASYDGVLYAINSNDELINSTDSGKTWNVMKTLGSTPNYQDIVLDEKNHNLFILSSTGYGGTANVSKLYLPTNEISKFHYAYDIDTYYGDYPNYPVSVTAYPSEVDPSESTVNIYTCSDFNAPAGLKNILRYTCDNNGDNGGTVWDNETIGTMEYDQVESHMDAFYDVYTSTELFTKVDKPLGRYTVFVEGSSSIVGMGSGSNTEGQEVNINFYGRDLNNELVDDGQYNLTFNINDLARNFETYNYDFEIDNTVPQILDGPTSNRSVATPLDDVEITFNVTDKNLHSVKLYYRHSVDSDWTEASFSSTPAAGLIGNYTAFIPGNDLSDELRYYIYVNDTAGNVLIDDNDGEYYSWRTVDIEWDSLQFLIDSSEICSYREVPVEQKFTKGIQMIKSVNVSTSTGVSVKLDKSGDTFTGNIPKILSVAAFDYDVFYIDVYDTKHTIYSGKHQAPLIDGILQTNGTIFSSESKLNSFDRIIFSAIVSNNSKYVSGVRIQVSPIESDAYTLTFDKDGENLYSLEFIPPNDTQGYLFSVYYVDVAGRTGVFKQGQLSAPSIGKPSLSRFHDEEEFTTGSLLYFDVTFNSTTQRYVQKVIVEYFMNGTWHQAILNYSEGSFRGYIGPFDDPMDLQYRIKYVDSVGQVTIASESNINVLPAMPSNAIEPSQALLIGLISALVGVTCGIAYTITNKKKIRDPREEFVQVFKKTREKDTKIYSVIDDPIFQYKAEEKKRGTQFLLTIAAAGLGVGLITTYILQSFEIAVLLSVALALSIVGLFNVMFSAAIDRASFDADKMGAAKRVAIIFLIGMYLAFFLIFIIGNNIPWFRYYINEASYDIGEIQIPSLIVSMTSSYFSTMIFVVLSTLNAVKALNEQVKNLSLSGSSLLDLFTIRREQTKKILKRLGVKNIMFLVILTFSIVTTTNLIRFGNIWIILLAPFGLSAIGVLALGLIRKKKVTQTSALVYNKVKCSECGEEVSEGTYCQECGKPLILGQPVDEDLKPCDSCEANNPLTSKYCRICGSEMSSKSLKDKMPDPKEQRKTLKKKKSS